MVVNALAVSHGSFDIGDRDTRDSDAVAGLATRATVEVILLDNETVLLNVFHSDVLVLDVGNIASFALVGLDAASVLAVDDDRVLESDILDSVVGLAANGSDGETMATRAVHTVYQNIRTRRDSNTIVLVVDMRVGQDDVVAGRDVESVRVVSGCLAATLRVGLVSDSVVQKDIREGDGVAVRDVEAVNRPILNVQVFESCVADVLCDDEMVRLLVLWR